MATLPANADMTGSGVTEGAFKGKLNDFLTFCRDCFGSTGTVASVRSALGLGAMATKADVSESDIATGAVTAGKIGSDAVTQVKILDGAATTSKIAATAVTSAKLASAAVLTGNIADGAVSAVKLASGAVTAVKIGDGEVSTAKLADAAVTPAKASGFPFMAAFASSLQSITAGGPLSFTHALGSAPILVLAELVNETAELGYAVGDVVYVGVGLQVNSAAQSYGVSLSRAAPTTVDLRFGANGMAVAHKSTGVLTFITLASWKLRIRAFA